MQIRTERIDSPFVSSFHCLIYTCSRRNGGRVHSYSLSLFSSRPKLSYESDLQRKINLSPNRKINRLEVEAERKSTEGTDVLFSSQGSWYWMIFAVVLGGRCVVLGLSIRGIYAPGCLLRLRVDSLSRPKSLEFSFQVRNDSDFAVLLCEILYLTGC